MSTQLTSNAKPIRITLVTPITPTIGCRLLAQSEADGTRVLTSEVVAIRPQTDGSLIVETVSSRYPVRIVSASFQTGPT